MKCYAGEGHSVPMGSREGTVSCQSLLLRERTRPSKPGIQTCQGPSMIGSSPLSVLGETEAQRGRCTGGQHKPLVGAQAEAAAQHQ